MCDLGSGSGIVEWVSVCWVAVRSRNFAFKKIHAFVQDQTADIKGRAPSHLPVRSESRTPGLGLSLIPTCRAHPMSGCPEAMLC